MEIWWKDWEEVFSLSKDKKIILYGRSEDWIPKTLKKVRYTPEYIVDRNPAYKDTDYLDIPVLSPETLFKENPNDTYVIITSGVYDGIIAILLDNGFEAGRHFCCCPTYKDFHILDEIRNYEKEIIVTSSDYHDKTKTRYSRAGGGIFLYHLGPNKLSRLVKGSFRQIVPVRDRYYAIEFVEVKLYVFDQNFKTIHTLPLDAANYCGIAYNEKRDILILVNAGQDTISYYQPEPFKLLERVRYSDKYEKNVTSQHHLNDVCVTEDHLYVAYFSHSGNWKKGNYDGGISEYHIDKLNDPPCLVVDGLWKPHSPEIIDGDLCYLDSMRGQLFVTNQMVAGEFPGFARGLAHDGRFYYIGSSEDMYISSRFGLTNNIMLNAGFYLFDNKTKASRFYPMLDSMNIHDLLIYEK